LPTGIDSTLIEKTMNIAKNVSIAVLMTACAAGCSTSGGYTYNSTSGSNSSQQQNGVPANAINQSTQSQTSTSSSWSTKSSFSSGNK